MNICVAMDMAAIVGCAVAAGGPSQPDEQRRLNYAGCGQTISYCTLCRSHDYVVLKTGHGLEFGLCTLESGISAHVRQDYAH